MNNDWDDNIYPQAYLITIRTFGTWIHGDERGSIDRHGKNIYGSPLIAPNENLRNLMKGKFNHPPFILDKNQRKTVEKAVIQVCHHRKYDLLAINVRSNHFHAVVEAETKPEGIIRDFKGYATRSLRNKNLVDDQVSIWSRGGSKRYLWKPRHVTLATEYVLYGQGNIKELLGR